MSRRAVDIRERYTGAHYAQPARGGRDADRRWFLLAVALSGTLVLLSVAVLLALLDRRASAAPAVPRSLGSAAAVVVAVSAGDSAADPAAGVAGLLADGPAPGRGDAGGAPVAQGVPRDRSQARSTTSGA